MQFEKIQNNGPKVPELVMDSLLKAMEAGTIRVGEELPPERDLAEALGISRNSLRECLSIMSFMGIVENRGNRKILVKNDLDSTNSIYHFLYVLINEDRTRSQHLQFFAHNQFNDRVIFS